jgi:DNA processing protein
VVRNVHVTEPSPAYALSLLRLRGIGRRTVVSVLARFSDEAALRGAAETEVASVVGRRATQALVNGLADDWDRAREWADLEVARHEQAGVQVVAFGSASYPPLLAVSPDPPALLYVLGSVDALSALLTVAVVGTRHPTIRGREIARRVARRFAEAGVVVVSGLAAGIDTAGHEGALEAGRTVAVLGTAIDDVYPAENRTLARRIEQAGALVSEYPIGFVNRSSAFAERDRIQAGLSLAVIPVQTGIKGGTQHTIRYAIDARRRVLCPRPVEAELHDPENEGILALIDGGRATPFEADDFPRLLDELPRLRAELLSAYPEPVSSADPAPKLIGPASPRGKKKQQASEGQTAWLLPDPTPTSSDLVTAGPTKDRRPAVGSPTPIHTMDEVLAALDEALDRVGPSYDEAAFDAIIRRWRARRYPDNP